MAKTTKIRKAAQGQACMIRIPGHCNFNPETTVLAHLNGYGVGGKHPDLFGSFACSSCHDIVDGRNHNHNLSASEVLIYFYEGVFRTQQLLLAQGLIQIQGGK